MTIREIFNKLFLLVHWPSVTTDKWGQKELIDLGAFGVGLSRDELEAIPASAFASLSTLEHFFSNRLTLGQLFVIFDKMNEVKFICSHMCVIASDLFENDKK